MSTSGRGDVVLKVRRAAGTEEVVGGMREVSERRGALGIEGGIVE
jgi:hypothetical protein